jgi:ATP-dependent RNA helicase DDX49/DBP8
MLSQDRRSLNAHNKAGRVSGTVSQAPCLADSFTFRAMASTLPSASLTLLENCTSATTCAIPISSSRPSTLAPEGSLPKNFRALGVSPWLVDALSAVGISTPTPVQAACVPAALAGRDVIGAAETGTGKTAAFALPILQHLAPDPHGVFAVVLTPTRELAFQISQHFRALGTQLALKTEVIVGGVDELAQASALARRPHVLVATPGRLALLLRQSSLTAGGNIFSRVRYLVIDEADRLIEPEYLPHLAAILDACTLPERQTLLFSATMTPSIEKLQELALHDSDAFRFDANQNRFATVKTLAQSYVFMPINLKETHLVHLLKVTRPCETCIIFVARCDTAEHLTTMLRVLGMRRVTAMHSDMKQTLRVDALQQLKGGSIRALIATDVASRGLDIPAVELVINYDLPRKTSTYVHRVGRTARAGRGGHAVSFVTQNDVELVHAIENELGRKLDAFPDHVDEKAVMEQLSSTLKARQVARLEITDNGFMARYDSRRAEARNTAKKRRRSEQRKVERAQRSLRDREQRATVSKSSAEATQ